MAGTSVQPTFDHVQSIVDAGNKLPNAPNLVPICASMSSEFLTPSAIYLKIAANSSSDYSFLFESAATTETIGRYSFVGTNPRKLLLSGPKHGLEADPLPALQNELEQYRVADVPSLRLPPMTGGAIGYVGYDCVKYFEPKTKRDMKDVLEIPESLFMLCDTVIAMDHFFQKVQVITYVHVPGPNVGEGALRTAYDQATKSIHKTLSTLRNQETPLPPQPPITLGNDFTSNVGRSGYESHVTNLKRHIVAGDIIQAVPSQRIARPTALHPFNIYRHLRTVNPSPYLFYLSLRDFQIIGASPELLVKKDPLTSRIITHPIAGTVKRGSTPAADAALAHSLRTSLKDRAEHVMLVDLARNDINRVCDPLTTRVDRLMVVQKFSHVQHLTSEVSGLLRADKTRFDAFRSIFPAGTVSGAPKVRAMELIAELEGEKRGVYAGSVGYFGYNTVTVDGEKAGAEEEGAMDTCIALRTMMTKDGVCYLQAGGGIVFDSDEGEEFEETVNKLAANVRCVEGAERAVWEEQRMEQDAGEGIEGAEAKAVPGGEIGQVRKEDGDVKVSLGDPDWHFPGPSSKYHTRALSRPELSTLRARSSGVTRPVGPSLESGRRVHRRALTGFGGESGAGVGGEGSKRGRLEALGKNGTPMTPVGKGLGLSGVEDGVRASPFSDYFTDDGRSPGFGDGKAGVQRLLVRLNEVGAMVLRLGEEVRGGEEGEVGRVVERKVGELERELEGLSVGRDVRGAEADGVGDSGIFMREDESPSQRARRSAKRADGVEDGLLSSSPTKATRDSERLLTTARDVLNRVTFAQEELRSRHDELQQLHATHNIELEDREQAIETLRAENEQLKADLGFGRSELLFLKLQLEGLKVEVGEVGALSGKARAQLEKGFKFLREDWKAVEGRFKQRAHEDGAENLDDSTDNDGAATDWRVSLHREHSGRVQRVSAIRRVAPAAETEAVDTAVPDHDNHTQRPALPTRDSSCQTHAFLFRAKSSLNANSNSNSIEPHADKAPASPVLAAKRSPANTDVQTESGNLALRSRSGDGEEGPEVRDQDGGAGAKVVLQPEVGEDLGAWVTADFDEGEELGVGVAAAKRRTEEDEHEEEEEDEEEDEEDEEEDDDNNDDDEKEEEEDDAEQKAEDEEETRTAIAAARDQDEPTISSQPVTDPVHEKTKTKTKTAWQELWDSLGNLAGMGEGEEDSE
ncbi:hypothetical protein MBLNU230_g8463t1 [Neophaeotheca triangularis]